MDGVSAVEPLTLGGARSPQPATMGLPWALLCVTDRRQPPMGRGEGHAPETREKNWPHVSYMCVQATQRNVTALRYSHRTLTVPYMCVEVPQNRGVASAYAWYLKGDGRWPIPIDGLEDMLSVICVLGSPTPYTLHQFTILMECSELTPPRPKPLSSCPKQHRLWTPHEPWFH